MHYPIKSYGTDWVNVGGVPRLGFLESLGGDVFGNLLNVGSGVLQSKWNLDVKKKQIKAEQALGLAAQQTAREVGIAQQQTARDIGVAGHGRYATTGSAWAQSTPKIVFAVALGLVGIVAVRAFMK